MEGVIEEHKSVRHRKKRLYHTIRQQIEFYLGDVNLSKDRFFSAQLNQSPYIDIDYFLRCNRIKKLTTDPQDILKAISKSDLVSATEDGTKLFRRKPVQSIENEDDCIIYVEDLPLDIDHDWLKNVFRKYGEVIYVSLPRFKNSRKLKGFAFVQFENSEGAQNALKEYNKLGACLSCDMHPTALRSVETYEGEKLPVVRLSPVAIQRIRYVSGEDENELIDAGDEEDDNLIHRNPEIDNTESDTIQTKKSDDESKSTVPAEADKSSIDLNNPKDAEEYEGENCPLVPLEDDKNSENCALKRKNIEEPASNDDGIGDEILPGDSLMEEDENAMEIGDAECKHECPVKKHKRKRNKKKKKPDEITFGMQILSKRDWKKLRNKYLTEQKKKASELKMQLRKTRYECEQFATLENREMEVVPQQLHNQQNEDISKSSSAVANPSTMQGVIIKLNLHEPISNLSSFKEEVRRYPDVLYIDAELNNSIAYVRCKNDESAKQFISSARWAQMDILQGKEEKNYRAKMLKDRSEKLNNKFVGGKIKTRGRDKLQKKADNAIRTHIKFNEWDY